MKHLFSKKIKVLTILVLIAVIAIAGCGKNTNIEKETETVIEDEKATREAVNVMEEESVAEENVVAKEEEVPFSMPEEAVSSSVIMHGNTAYIVGRHAVATMDVTTGESKIIWEYDGETNDISKFNIGRGILLNDKLYFYSEFDADGDYYKMLQVINADGSDYKIIDRYSGDIYNTGDMYYRDGMLYVDGNGTKDSYVINDEGNITKTIERSSLDVYADKSDEREFLSYEYGSGKMRYSLAGAIDHKMIVIDGGDEELLYDINSGREVILGGSVVAANKDMLLICETMNDKYIYGTIDYKSGQYTYLFRDEADRIIITIDDKYVYSYTSEESGNAVFYKTSLNNGKETEIYNFKLSESAINDFISDYFPPVIAGDYLFTAESHDYGLYVQAVNLTSGEVRVMDNAYYDTGISEAGKLVAKRKTVDVDDGTRLITAYSNVFNVDTKYSGAKAINDIINTQAQVVFEELEQYKEEMEGFYESYQPDGGYFGTYSFDISCDGIEYFDGHILSVVLDGYDYYGGAHGNPYRCPYVFNVDTGRQFGLKDIVNISEEEFVDIVSNEFLNLADEDEEYTMFWLRDEIAEYLASELSLEFENYYFTEDGVVLFFYPYEIAAYAEGFPEVTIPFNMLGVDLKAMAEDVEETEEETTETE